MADVFISYAHIDDLPLNEGQPGWIAQFHRRLEVRLSQLLGEKPKIWRDAKLTGTDAFGDAILEQLPNVKALVSIVSPRYIKSEWCLREANEFLKRAELTGGINVQKKYRLIKVLKTPVQQEEVPQPLNDLFGRQLGFQFFSIDPDTGRPHEFDEEFGPDARRLFLERIYDLAYDICELLRLLGSTTPKVPALAPGEVSKTVYLATTTADLQEERQRLLRELQERGHKVLPDVPQPMIGPDLEAAVRADLARCQLAVHLVGNRYGVVPEDSQESIVQIQNRLASEWAQETKSPRFLWLPRDFAGKDERQQQFIQHVLNDAAAQHGAEIVRDTLERLKGLVLEKLNPPPKPAPPVTTTKGAGPSAPARIYLICDRADDGPLLQAVEDQLFDRGFDVSRPCFDGTEAEVSAAHRQFLQASDAVLIYYGAASRSWVDMKLLDLAQAPGYGRTGPFRAVGVCVAPPDDRNKPRFRTHAAMVLKVGDPLDPAALAPFIEAISTASPTA